MQANTAIEITSVSYTHLDVYKRQHNKHDTNKTHTTQRQHNEHLGKFTNIQT